MAVPTVDLVGIRAPKFRYESRANVNPTWISRDQGRPIQLNRVDYDRSTGSVISVQIGPNQIATTTHDVIGAEVRARSTVGTGALIAVKGEPNAVSSTAGLTAARSFESNITVKGTRTVSADICALRTFLDVDSTVTVTGKKSVIKVASPNVSQWQYLADIESGNSALVATNADRAATHVIPIRFGSTDLWLLATDALS